MKDGRHVNDLPKPVKFNELQEQITLSLSQHSRTREGRLCDLCTRGDAAFYCHQCRESLCDLCHVKHGQASALKGHATDLIGHVTFCGAHPPVKAELYCSPCKVAVCRRCLMVDHEGHPTGDLAQTAATSRGRLQQLREQVVSRHKAGPSTERAEQLIREHIHVHSKIIDVIEMILGVQEKLETKLDELKKDAEFLGNFLPQQNDKFKKHLTLLERETTEYHYKLETIDQLLTSQNAVSVIHGEAKLSTQEADRKVWQPFQHKIPELGDDYNQLLKCLSPGKVFSMNSYKPTDGKLLL